MKLDSLLSLVSSCLVLCGVDMETNHHHTTEDTIHIPEWNQCHETISDESTDRGVMIACNYLTYCLQTAKQPDTDYIKGLANGTN